MRLDKWLWTMRVYKTRSDAAEGCRTNRVLVNDSFAKPSREVKVGDVVSVKKMPVTYSFRITELVGNRQPAKNVLTYLENLTPASELDKLNIPRETVFVSRDRGTGRPTKKERRDVDALLEEMFSDED